MKTFSFIVDGVKYKCIADKAIGVTVYKGDKPFRCILNADLPINMKAMKKLYGKDLHNKEQLKAGYLKLWKECFSTKIPKEVRYRSLSDTERGAFTVNLAPICPFGG